MAVKAFGSNAKSVWLLNSDNTPFAMDWREFNAATRVAHGAQPAHIGQIPGAFSNPPSDLPANPSVQIGVKGPPIKYL